MWNVTQLKSKNKSYGKELITWKLTFVMLLLVFSAIRHLCWCRDCWLAHYAVALHNDVGILDEQHVDSLKAPFRFFMRTETEDLDRRVERVGRTFQLVVGPPFSRLVWKLFVKRDDVLISRTRFRKGLLWVTIFQISPNEFDIRW